MNASQVPSPRLGPVVISVPGMRDGPSVGGGCCGAVALDDLVRDELESWPAIIVSSLDLDAETVTVSVDPDRQDQLEYAAEALRDLGFTDLEINRPHPAPGPPPQGQGPLR